MSHSVTLTFALGLLSFARASLDSRGLVETNATCQENFEWAFSKQDLSPCFLLAAVSAPCYQGEFFAKALLPGNHYDPPLKAKGTVNQCSCSWAAYNLMMACTTCQGQTSSVSTWPSYRAECGDLISNTT
ncbi:hypothetical protein L218DRAFT_869836 [Marasmius fiardii PR-910]|nr:hypothetical protein L218DRAFT_869836 [Marasmius fiardii PR-910]